MNTICLIKKFKTISYSLICFAITYILFMNYVCAQCFSYIGQSNIKFKIDEIKPKINLYQKDLDDIYISKNELLIRTGEKCKIVKQKLNISYIKHISLGEAV